MIALLAPALLFFSNALMHITLFTRLPEISSAAGLDKAGLGLALLALPIGTVLALPIAGRLNDRLGPHVAAPTMLLVNTLMMPLFALVPGLAIGLLFASYSFVRTILEVAQNMVALGIERRTGVSVLSRSHGFWSVGLFVGSLAAGMLAGIGASPLWHQIIASAAVIFLMILFRAVAPHDFPAIPKAGSGRLPFAIPGRAILLIFAMTVGIGLTEGTVYDWSIFYMQDVIGADPSTAGYSFAAFTIGMGVTRMLGDSLRMRFSDATLVRGNVVMCACGIAVLLMSPGPQQAGVALAMLGAGVALNAPIGVAVVSRLPGRSTAENMAALSMVALIVTFGMPALFGFVAEALGLRIVFAALLPILAVGFLLAPVAGRGAKVVNGSERAALPEI